MDLWAVMAEIRDRVADVEVPGRPGQTVRVHRMGEQGAVRPPLVLVGLPEGITFDATQQRGFDRVPDLPLIILAGAAARRPTFEHLAAYVNGGGPSSVKAALDSTPARRYDSCSTVRVTGADFTDVTFEDTDYTSVWFHLDITGKGV